MANKLRKRNTISRKKILVTILVLIAMFGINIGYSYLETMLLINANVEINPYLRAKVDTEILGVPMTAYLDDRVSPYVTSSSGINFNTISSDTNGKGLYISKGTENSNNPLLYFRGDVTNNNVLIGDSCWKIIRTTEDGGTKLLYNGTKYQYADIDRASYINLVNDSSYPFTYDEATKKWTSTNHTHGTHAKIKFSVPENGDYILEGYVSSEIGNSNGASENDNIENGDNFNFSMNSDTTTSLTSGEGTVIYNLSGLKTTDVINIGYSKNASITNGDDKITFSLRKVNGVVTCENKEHDSVIYSEATGKAGYVMREVRILYGSNSKSLVDVGYMRPTSSTKYTIQTFTNSSNIIYGSDVTWDGSSYTLTTTQTGVDATHHYTCMNTATTCTQVAYVYNTSQNNVLHYILLTNGENLENVKTSAFTNESDSNVKSIIDNWYKNNMDSYTSLFEDYAYCNSRTFSSGGLYSIKSSLGNSYFRMSSNLSVTSECTNQNDRFTVSDTTDGNGKLTYPVGLPTFTELEYAGLSHSGDNVGNYLTSGTPYWTMSPAGVINYNDNGNYYPTTAMKGVGENGLILNYLNSSLLGIRPVVTLKKGIKSSSGTGTVTDPFVIS